MELPSSFLYFKKSLSDLFHNFSNSFPHGRRGKINGLTVRNVNVSQDSSLKLSLYAVFSGFTLLPNHEVVYPKMSPASIFIEEE